MLQYTRIWRVFAILLVCTCYIVRADDTSTTASDLQTPVAPPAAASSPTSPTQGSDVAAAATVADGTTQEDATGIHFVNIEKQKASQEQAKHDAESMYGIVITCIYVMLSFTSTVQNSPFFWFFVTPIFSVCALIRMRHNRFSIPSSHTHLERTREEHQDAQRHSQSFPEIPSQFRAKARLWIADSDVPVLILYHHDHESAMSREDFYQLIEGRHQRVYSNIKHFGEGKQFMIFHKQENTPRACFETPTTGAAIDIKALQEESEFMGPSHLIINGRNITCNHWELWYEGHRIEFCLDPETDKPLIFEAPWFRLDVLDFEPSPQPARLFDATRASVAACGVIGEKPQRSSAGQPIPPRPF
jgi:hypothetical protein